MKNNSNLIKVITVLSVILLVVAAYSLLMLYPAPKKLNGEGDYISDSSNDALIGGDFTLTDFDNNLFSSEAMKGKYSIVYFGFTFCPDICPTALNIISHALNDLAKYQIDVNAIFISIDPKRDNPKMMKEFLGSFHQKVIGLTGTDEQVREVADKYKVYYDVDTHSGTGRNDYLLNHSSFIYIMNKNGKYVKHFNIDTKSEEIVNYLRVANQN